MMDRLRSGFVLLGLALLPGLAGAASPGDVNTDGVVDGRDAVLLQRFLVGDATLSAAGEAAADLGPLVAGAYAPDGSVNSGDLVVLLRAIAGEVDLPVAPAAPVLDAIVGAVAQNPFLAEGTAEPGVDVTLYVNGEAQQTLPADGSGNFSINAILLDGPNTLFAIATDANGIDSLESNAEVADYQRQNPPPPKFEALNAFEVWTPGNGDPYLVQPGFSIGSTGRLVIRPGTVIRVADGVQILVSGELTAQGSEGNEVVFTSTRTADTIPPAARGDWSGIRYEQNSGTGSLRHAVIEYATDPLYIMSGTDVDVTDVKIREFTGTGLRTSPISQRTFRRLTIDNSAGPRQGNGIRFIGAVYSVVLEESFIGGLSTGILAQQGQGPTIRNQNIITNNSTGIRISQCAARVLDGNTISHNDLGVSGGGTATTPLVNGNIFEFNTVNLSPASSSTFAVFDARNNYWGTTVVADIADTISDRTDTGMGPVVAFTPFLALDPDGNLIPVPGNFLTGRLIGTYGIPEDGLPYQAVGALTIEAGTAATIEAGVTIEFGAGTSLIAEGTLTVAGTVDDKVTLTSAAKAGQSDWEGVRIEPESANTAIDFAVIEYANTAVHLVQGGQPVSVTNSDILHFSRGIRASDSSGHVFANNRFEVGDTPGLTESGMVLTGVAASITGNTFTGHPTQGLGTAILVQGAFDNGALQTEILGNTISNSRFGIQILSNQLDADLALRPVINDNVFTGNFDANLYLAGTWELGANHVIDARRNDWGVTTVAGIRATIELVGDSNETPVDFSDFRDEFGVIIPGVHFTTPLIGVVHDQDVFKPGLGELATIQFELLVPATTTLSIYPEDDDVLGTPLYEETVALAAGAHSLTWDGRTDAGEYVVPEAYQYVVTAVTSDGTDLFSPLRPGGGDLLGRVILSRDIPLDLEFNTHRNDHLVLHLDVMEVRRRAGGLVRVETPNGPVSVDLYNRALSPGTHVITWDGRVPFSDDLPPGVVPGEILEGEFPLNGGVTSKNMRVNHVVVEGTAPTILTAELPPVVAVQSTPYLIYHSYHQISEIAYRLDQDSQVTVKMLPPGIYDPADPSAITLIDDQLQPASNGLGEPETYLAVWTGFDELAGPDAGNDPLFWVDEDIDTAFTFTIEATSVLTGQQTVYRGVLQARN
ncbi:MAG: right-handed parallel beta-helix repeat-containing protein [Proteobacteria bacterium]|nr:right-handed parallel beta-helix repeat-containing protein [Pseudomonadota bacterium]